LNSYKLGQLTEFSVFNWNALYHVWKGIDLFHVYSTCGYRPFPYSRRQEGETFKDFQKDYLQNELFLFKRVIISSSSPQFSGIVKLKMVASELGTQVKKKQYFFLLFITIGRSNKDKSGKGFLSNHKWHYFTIWKAHHT
jgi:hypothetical protein